MEAFFKLILGLVGGGKKKQWVQNWPAKFGGGAITGRQNSEAVPKLAGNIPRRCQPLAILEQIGGFSISFQNILQQRAARIQKLPVATQGVWPSNSEVNLGRGMLGTGMPVPRLTSDRTVDDSYDCLGQVFFC